ncbi:hypothetical protein DQ238_04275 [Geodermatophilus sp. TF02-6]|uniref:hypothetical protein n=1 Tax=Geodermatophilus sp. TF02-6 TaxID=2250575 RepID=UPI000DE9693B|nr:hypothetical protein [Geodermatophilus sp. TF02-6]RBY82508.1 hypothetical protein DQ238_04275 [Geodermatophilus sp. TF02-6]
MDPHDPSDLLLRRAAEEQGWSDDELARHTRSGHLARLRPGAYLLGGPPTAEETRHRLLVHATLAGLRRPAAVSHQSAAVLLGLPVWGAGLGRVHVTRRPPASSEVGRYLRCHVARLGDDEVVEVDGLPVTAPTRTLLDLGRSLPLGAAVVSLDAALFQRLVHPAELAAGLAAITGTRGSRAAARAVRFADGRSESVGESRSRVLLHRLGLGPSTLQLPISTSSGVFLGRADFAWEQARVVGEFDGRIEYGRLLRPGQEPGDAVFEEKRREDAVRAEDWGVVRWTWADLTPAVLGPRVRRALAWAGRRAG